MNTPAIVFNILIKFSGDGAINIIATEPIKKPKKYDLSSDLYASYIFFLTLPYSALTNASKSHLFLPSLTISAFLVSAVVAFAGVIGFVGIMVPHLIKQLSPAKHLHIYLLSLLGGAILLLFADMIVRNVFVFEIPVGIITSLIGIPFFIYVLKKGNND